MSPPYVRRGTVLAGRQAPRVQSTDTPGCGPQACCGLCSFIPMSAVMAQTFPISHQPASASLRGPVHLLQFIYFLPVPECPHFLMRILPVRLDSSCFHVQRNEKASMTLCCIALPTEGLGLSLGSVSASSAPKPTFSRPASSIPTLCSVSHPIPQHALVLFQTGACTRGPPG